MEDGVQKDEFNVDPNEVISQRSGQVLLKSTLLKADHFPGCQNTKLVPSFENAPNFRQVSGLRIFGVAIPTVSGVRIVLDLLDGRTSKVLWQNMREEPVLYINGNPYVVREADKPFANLEYTGIDRQRVEDMEQRLKQDVIKEIGIYQGHVLITDENDDLQLVQKWEEVNEDDVQTPQDVFHQLRMQGYLVDYLRIPITDEKAPKELDCDLLVQRCSQVEPGSALVFNCQMGRGRTTTGMIIASLLFLRRSKEFPEDVQIQLQVERLGQHQSEDSNDDKILKKGFYGVVRSLLRVLERGPEAKKILDQVIDATNHMQNLREAIFQYRDRLPKEQNEKKRNSILHVTLVSFFLNKLVGHGMMDLGIFRKETFQQFMRKRPEFKSVLKRMLRRDPMSALGLHASVDRTSWNLNGIEFIQKRRGSVLGPNTILKEDHFPGIEDPRIHQRINGAPNFRGVGHLPVYGVGMPTIEGIKSLLTDIGAGPNSTNKIPALWFNWREEPLVYVNGNPFVLREYFRPFKNLKEYSNIDTKHLERMEERLKRDILDEVEKNGGCVLVALERATSEVEIGMLEDKWEVIEDKEAIQTPAEVYQQLQKEGFQIVYYRLPLTDGSAPDLSDVDWILHSMETHQETNNNFSVVFNCQNGAGRTTVGMVLASLVFHQSSPSPLKTFYSLQSNVEDPVWDSCSKGRYLGVRRLIHLLEKGLMAKKKVDQMIDWCDSVVNLRKAIGFYRMGMIHQLPEILSRHSTFGRAVAYLHRYCFLIIVAAYLTQSPPSSTFSAWVASRKDITMALDSIKSSPSDALSILTPRKISKTDSWTGLDEIASQEDELRILQTRQYNILTPRTILKGNRKTTNHSRADLRQVLQRPIYTIGDPSVKTLRNILDQLGKDHKEIYVIDIREELIVYVNGMPYTFRDLERPISSLYQVGIAVEDLRRMEETLKFNIVQEMTQHEGKVLLHEEVSTPLLNKTNSSSRHSARDEIAQMVEATSSTVLPVIKETTKLSELEKGICTPEDIFHGLKMEGYGLKYSRVPLSRQRTPHARDLDSLWASLGPNSNPETVHLIISRVSTGSSARFTAAFFAMVSKWKQKSTKMELTGQKDESKLALGEYRGIMNLCRVLPDGSECKAEVDASIDACSEIGSLREDILSCKYSSGTQSSEASRLGLHYLKRYFFLIAFRCYLDYHQDNESFMEWVAQRKELRHLVTTIKLE